MLIAGVDHAGLVFRDISSRGRRPISLKNMHGLMSGIANNVLLSALCLKLFPIMTPNNGPRSLITLHWLNDLDLIN